MSTITGIEIIEERQTLSLKVSKEALVRFVAQELDRQPGDIGTFRAEALDDGSLVLHGSWVAR